MEKSLSRKIGEGVFWLGSHSIVVKIVGLLTVFLILRRLSVYEYGVSELVFSVVGILSLFLLPGLNDLILSEFGREKGRENLGTMKKLFFDYAKLGLVLGVILWIILFFGADIINDYYGKNIANLFRISSFLFLISAFKSLMKLIFNAYLKFFTISVWNFSEELLKLGFLALFFFYFNFRMEGLFLAHVLSQFLALLILLPSFFKIYKSFVPIPMAADISLKQIIFRHGKWAILVDYTKSLGDNLRLWLIKFFLGTEMVGLFAVAYGLYEHTSALFPLNAVIKPLIPQYFHDKEKFYRLIAKSIKYQFLGYLTIVIIAFFLFPPIIIRLFPNYASSMFLFRGFLLTLLIVSFSGIFTYVFYAIRAQKRFFINLVLWTFSILLLFPLFIYFFGTAGIIFAFSLTAIIVAVDRYAALKKILPDFYLSLKDFFSLDEMDRYFLKTIKNFIFYRLGLDTGRGKVA